ncbi:MAG: hypothetical protein HYU36_02285 [Planctomycetes bacterium]|nr:hypothetical protein [Planctomycetota bacterium]
MADSQAAEGKTTFLGRLFRKPNAAEASGGEKAEPVPATPTPSVTETQAVAATRPPVASPVLAAAPTATASPEARPSAPSHSTTASKPVVAQASKPVVTPASKPVTPAGVPSAASHASKPATTVSARPGASGAAEGKSHAPTGGKYIVRVDCMMFDKRSRDSAAALVAEIRGISKEEAQQEMDKAGKRRLILAKGLTEQVAKDYATRMNAIQPKCADYRESLA